MSPSPPTQPHQSRDAPLRQKLRESWPPADWQSLTVLVAVSGGADSVALLRAMASLRTEWDVDRAEESPPTEKKSPSGRIVVAHFDHGWRPEAAAEAKFVRDLAESLQLEVQLGRAESTRNARSEQSARHARYRFLEQAAADTGARFVATAHTADDQAETILHRIVRGTSLDGVAGIPRIRQINPSATLIRPLLQVTRREVLAYLALLNQPFRHDASNDDVQFTRNRIRHELIPWLQSHLNHDVNAALMRLGQLSHETAQVLDSLVDKLELEWQVTRHVDHVSIEPQVNSNTQGLIVRRLFIRQWQAQGWSQRDMTHGHWCELEKLVTTVQKKVLNLPGDIRADFTGKVLVLRGQDQVVDFTD